MPIEHIDDWEKRLDRQDAFWERAIIDRPVVNMTAPKTNPEYPPPPAKEYASQRERWFDAEYIAECAVHSVRNTEYLGDALPNLNPNLGPDVFAAFFGAAMEFGERTSWSIPILHDWADAGEIRFSEDNAYWKALLKMTDTFLEIGRGHYYTGLTDFHPGGDAVAAFRDPLELNIDMIENVDAVKDLLARVTDVFLHVYDTCVERLLAAGQAVTCWAGIVSRRRWHVPSNDFSCMVSNAMFRDVFLDSIERECRHLEASIYHLDGPNSLQHLDSLLEIPELDAIQWVWGAGKGPVTRWLDVYKRCQAAGKGIQLKTGVEDLDTIMSELKPEGVWLRIHGVENREHGEALLKRVSAWT